MCIVSQPVLFQSVASFLNPTEVVHSYTLINICNYLTVIFNVVAQIKQHTTV